MDNSTHFSILNTTEFDVDNDKLFEQICNLLLESGYYRVRLTNLLPFDKILGGLAWGVSSTYYPLEVDLWLAYSEYATMGLKLQVAEGVCNALKEMKCPKPLQPHQITGLDFGTIYPVVVWLMEMVNSARLLMGDKLRSYAEFVYKKIL
ncbi:CCDC93 N-terminal domain-containing protein [Entamoeba marina]